MNYINKNLIKVSFSYRTPPRKDFRNINFIKNQKNQDNNGNNKGGRGIHKEKV